MSAANHYDVIIIGTGAGGGTLAYHLAPSGKRILLLERGDYVPREKDNWSTRAVNVEGKYNTKEAWRDIDGKELHPHTNYFVGGNTKFYGAALFRLREEDFGEIRHHGGVSPAWPISYDESRAVLHRSRTSLPGARQRGEDPTEPWASAPYPFPAVSHEPRIQQLHDDLARAGLQAVSRAARNSARRERTATSACIRCNTCDGYPCLVNAKSDAQVICVDPALDLPQRVAADQRQGQAAGDQRHRAARSARSSSSATACMKTYSGDIVVVSCGAINSAALLLRSANDNHPRGLANGSDVVGRHYMGHINSVLMAISKCPNPTVFQKTLAVNDFYFGSKDWDFPMGHISFVGKLDADDAAGGRAGDRSRMDAGLDGQALAGFLADLGRSAGSGQSGDARSRRQHRAELQTEQRRRSQASEGEAARS